MFNLNCVILRCFSQHSLSARSKQENALLFPKLLLSVGRSVGKKIAGAVFFFFKT